MTLKPLGKVKELVESVGMGISYAYDDLVFLEHNAFLLQFGKDNKTLFVHANEEAKPEEVSECIARLEKAAALQELTIKKGKVYKLSQAEDNMVTLEFYEKVAEGR